MSARPRYNGSAEDLLEGLRPYVTSAAWFQYQEKLSDPIRPDILVAHKHLVRTLTELSPNMSFASGQLKQVLTMIMRERCFEELQDDDSCDDWVQTCSKRIQTACRHIAQARLRKPPPRWLALVYDGGDGDSIEVEPQLNMSSIEVEDSAADGHGHGPDRVGDTDSGTEPAEDGACEDAQLPASQAPTMTLT